MNQILEEQLLIVMKLLLAKSQYFIIIAFKMLKMEYKKSIRWKKLELVLYGNFIYRI